MIRIVIALAAGLALAGNAFAQIEIKRVLPYRNEKHRMPRLPEVLLRDLQLDRLACLLECAEER